MNDREKKICEKFSKRDHLGYVHCKEFPLVVNPDAFLCKANARYDRSKREWVPNI